MYRITFDINAEKIFRKLDKNEQQKINKKVEKLKNDPELGKRLSGNFYGLWSLRVDKFRILYRIIEEKLIIILLKIDHRKDIYRW